MADKNKLLETLMNQKASLPYQTNLSDADKIAFAQWVANNKVPVDLSKQSDYDMPGFYKALQAGDSQAESGVSPLDNQMHFTDKFKTPNHDTFSAESQYGNAQAPSWQGNALRNPDGSLNALELPDQNILKAAQQGALQKLLKNVK